jgi:S-adenosylmethionine:tRNA ribosyltransferase-isomerase
VTIVDFSLPPALEAHEPPEARGIRRDGVRLLVGRRGSGAVSEHAFADLADLLRPGDVLVVNTSATLPAAVGIAGRDLTLHFSTELPDGGWVVELRRTSGKATVPYAGGQPGQRYELVGGGAVVLTEPYSTGRLWVAEPHLSGVGVVDYLHRHGAPIRYDYLTRPWPLEYYQTVFARHPGSAEMPSAGRPFTHRMVTRLVTAGVLVVPVLLHTGVASPEAHERPYPEYVNVPAPSARTITAARHDGGRIVAVGTTVVRALESAADASGEVHARRGHTDLIVTEERGVNAVDALLTGLHEPRSSHLDMLAAIAGRPLLEACYAEAARTGFLWHEFGDLNLLLP